MGMTLGRRALGALGPRGGSEVDYGVYGRSRRAPTEGRPERRWPKASVGAADKRPVG